MLAFTADNHLGLTAQWSIKDRKDDFLKAFENVINTVLSNDKVNALIIGGDLFETAYPPSFSVEFVQKQVRRLSVAGKRVFGIDGNHDIAECKWLKVCGITPLSEDPICIDGRMVCGLSFRRSSEIISALSFMVDRGVKCEVLVLHLVLGELNRMSASSDITGEEILPMLKAMGVRSVLMGHIHICQQIDIGGIMFSYCGSTELCSMNEPKEKSIDLLDLDGPKPVIIQVPISTRKIVNTVIGNEKEFAAYEASDKDKEALQAVYISTDIKDGVKRLRDIAKSTDLMMRIMAVHPNDPEPLKTIDRTTGVIGLEQAIEKEFKPDSEEASLIRAILHSPDTLKVTVDNFMKGNHD